MEGWLFLLLATITLVSAVLVVVTTNVVRAACWLVATLGGAAGLFFLLGADFVGATQLLIYVGGTLVLLIFGVMLTATGSYVRLESRPGDWALALVVGGLMLGLLAFVLTRPVFSNPARFPGVADAGPAARVTTSRIGLAFLGLTEPAEPDDAGGPSGGQGTAPASGYLLPFEIVSVHLVVVLVGAAYLARTRRHRSDEEAAA